MMWVSQSIRNKSYAIAILAAQSPAKRVPRIGGIVARPVGKEFSGLLGLFYRGR